jgi:hypothetical protein
MALSSSHAMRSSLRSVASAAIKFAGDVSTAMAFRFMSR